MRILRFRPNQALQQTAGACSVFGTCSPPSPRLLLSCVVEEARVDRLDRSDIGTIDFGDIGPTRASVRSAGHNVDIVRASRGTDLFRTCRGLARTKTRTDVRICWQLRMVRIGLIVR